MNEEFETAVNTTSNDSVSKIAVETNTSKKRTRKTTEESLAELEKEEKALQAKKKALKAKLSTEKRKQDTKEKIILGAIIKSYLGDYQEGDEGRLLAFIKAQDERGSFFSKAMGRYPQNINNN